MGLLEPPRKLKKGDDRSNFCSGADELDEWLKQYASQSQRANNAVTYVSMLDGCVVGYYAIATAGVSRGEFSPDFGKGRPTSIPCILLARLAVDKRMQGQHLGRSLLRDALERAVHVSDSVGAAGMLIHCRDANAKDFYLAQAEFLQSPVEPLHLMLPIKESRAALGRSPG